MKKTLKTMLAIVAGAAAITACQKENIVEGGDAPQTVSVLNPMTFTAYMEGQDPVSKTSIDASHYDTDHLYDVKWVAGDKISVFDGATENNGNQEFTLDTGAGTASGTFFGEAAEADTYYAIYPYAPTKKLTLDDIEAAVDESTYSTIETNLQVLGMFMLMEGPETVQQMMNYLGISLEAQKLIITYLKDETIGIVREGDSFKEVIIPAVQTVSEGQFVDPKAMLMIAKSDDDSSFSFKNICAYIRVTPKFDCYAIGIKSNGGLNIAGTVTVNYNEGNPTATVTANGVDEVILGGTIKAGNCYYIAVLPATLSSGFSIQFLATDATRHFYTRSTSNSMALIRNNVTNLGSFETTGYWTGNTPSIGNDGNGHNWQMVTPTLKLATTSADKSFDNKKHDNYDWGNDWVLPTEADLTPLLGRFNCCSEDPYDTATIRGTGIFNFAPPMEISEARGYNMSGLWCDEDKKFIQIDGSYKGGVLLTDNDGVQVVPIFYKYTK